MKSDEINNSIEEQDSMQNRFSVKRLTPVYANIYHFSTMFNSACSCCGLGLYHTGIEIFEHEYMYYGFDGDQSGVGYIEPMTAAYEFCEQVLLGHTELSPFQVESHILQPLHMDFIGRYCHMKEIGMIFWVSIVTTLPYGLPTCCRLKIQCQVRYLLSLIASIASVAVSQIVFQMAAWTGLTSRVKTIIPSSRKVCMYLLAESDQFLKIVINYKHWLNHVREFIDFRIRSNLQKSISPFSPQTYKIRSGSSFQPDSNDSSTRLLRSKWLFPPDILSKIQWQSRKRPFSFIFAYNYLQLAKSIKVGTSLFQINVKSSALCGMKPKFLRLKRACQRVMNKRE